MLSPWKKTLIIVVPLTIIYGYCCSFDNNIGYCCSFDKSVVIAILLKIHVIVLLTLYGYWCSLYSTTVIVVLLTTIWLLVSPWQKYLAIGVPLTTVFGYWCPLDNTIWFVVSFTSLVVVFKFHVFTSNWGGWKWFEDKLFLIFWENFVKCLVEQH